MGRFFFDQANRINQWHESKTEHIGFDQKEIIAGYEKLGQEWNWVLTLHNLSKGDFQKEEYILGLPIKVVLVKLQVMNNIAAAEKRYKDSLRI